MDDCEFLSSEMSEFTKELEERAFLEGIPFKCVFELTARCNFNCKMCYIHMNDAQIKARGRELTNEEWLRIAEEARDAGTLYLNLTGGEIFARPHFRELYEKLSQMGFLIQLQSNGYLIDEKVIAWLSENPPYAIRFSLYGASNETYAAVCGVKDGFDRVSHAVDLIKQAGIPIYLVSTIVKENQNDLEAMYRFAEERKVLFTPSATVVHPVRGATADAKNHKLSLKSGELHILKKVKRLYGPYSSAFGMCGSFRKSAWITWDGKMQMCTFMESPNICLQNKTFSDAWQELLSALETLQKPETCQSCRYEGFCKKCPGVLSAECGAPNRVTAEFCGTAKLLYHALFDENESD